MNAKGQPLMVLLMAVVAVPLLAQQGDPPAGAPALPRPTTASRASAGGSSALAESMHVVGAVVTFGSDRLDLKVEKALPPSSESTSELVGRTVAFLIDGATEKPAELKAGDRVDLWFTQAGSRRRAVRIAVVTVSGEASPGAGEEKLALTPAEAGGRGGGEPAPRMVRESAAATGRPSLSQPDAGGVAAVTAPRTVVAQAALEGETADHAGAKPLEPARTRAAASTAPPTTATHAVLGRPAAAGDPPALAPSVPEGAIETGGAVAQPALDTPPPAEVPPGPDAPVPFVALGAVAALAALVMLRFTLRAGHVDLRIGSGKGGMR